MATGSAANLSHYSAVLKNFYLPGVQEYLNHDKYLADKIEATEEDVSGKNFTIECHYGRNTGTGARGDGGALPSAGYQKFKTCTCPMRYNYGRIEITGPTIAATRDDRGAYARALDTEVRGIVNDMGREINRQMWGCGYGTLARWRSGSSTSITLQKMYRGNSAGGDGFGSAFGGKYLNPNGNNAAVIVVLSGMSGASGTYSVDSTNIAVSALTKGTQYDTITATATGETEAAGCFYVRPSNLATHTSAPSSRREMMGLRGLVTDTNLDVIAGNSGSYTGLDKYTDPLQTLNISSYSWFKAIVDSHSSGRYAGQRALTFELMQTMFDMVEEQAGKDYGPDTIITTRALRREYLELCRADRRTINTMELDGGWTGLDYNGVPLLVDNDAIDGEIYFLTLQDLKVYRMSDYDWMQKDGAILSRISGYDVYEAVLFRYAEFAIKNRATQGVLTDLAYTKGANEGYGT